MPMSHTVYNAGKDGILDGTIDCDTDTLKAVLIMDSAQTAVDITTDSEKDKLTLSAMDGGSGISTSAEFDTSYTRPTLSIDDGYDAANDQFYLNGTADSTLSSLSSGTYPIEGILIYKHVTNDSDSIPIVYVPLASLESPNGVDFVLNINGVKFLKGADGSASGTTIYPAGMQGILNGSIDLTGDTLKLILINDQIDVATDIDADTLSDLNTGAGLTGAEHDSGYTRPTLSSVTVTQDDTNNVAELDAADVTISSLAAGTYPIRSVLVYKHVDGTESNDIPICLLKYGSDRTPDGSDFVVSFGADGILKM